MEMNTLNKIESLGIKLPIVLYVLGLFIHNAYLSKCSVSDFDILQTRYIYTGFTAVSLITGVSVLLMLRLDLTDVTLNLKPPNFFAWLARFPLVTLLLFFWLAPADSLTQGYLRDALGLRPAIFVVNLLMLLAYGFLFGLIFVSFGAVFKKDYVWISVAKKALAWLSIPLLGMVYFLSLHYKYLADILDFMAFPAVLVFVFLASASDFQKGIVFESEAVPDTGSQLSKLFVRFVYPFFQFVLATGVLLAYANGVYPMIPPNYGGGKPVDALVITGEDTLRTKVISQDANWLITVSSDTTNVVQIKTSDIKKLELLRR